jgi:hypothetical protein
MRLLLFGRCIAKASASNRLIGDHAAQLLIQWLK